MAWFKVDDNDAFDPEVVDLGNAAYGAWVRLGAYANQHLTDGIVPISVARMIASGRELDRLLDHNWLRVDGNGFVLVDYHRDQPTSEEVLERRAKRAEAGRAGGLASARARAAKATASGQANASASGEAKSNPDPTRPVPAEQPSVDPPTPPEAVAQMPIAEMQRIWEQVTGQSAIFDRDLPGVRDRIWYYAAGASARGRSPAEVAVEAVGHFVAYRDACSPGYKPRLSGFKFNEHWPTIEGMLNGQTLDAKPRDPDAPPTMVTGLDFSKRKEGA